MRKVVSYIVALVLANLLTSVLFAQNITINGTIQNSQSKESVAAVSVTVKGSSAGTFTDDKGNFKISVDQKFPITLNISSVGYLSQEVIVNNASQH
jgi:hypothetical protein